MKTITIKKNYEFSPNSKVILHYGSTCIHIKGFGQVSVSIEPGEELYASQLWTQSNRIKYDQAFDKASYVIKPRLGKILAFVILLVFLICIIWFIFTRSRLSVIPIVPFIIYVALYLSVLKNKYLIIKAEKEIKG